MAIIRKATFRSFHQGVVVTLSLRQDGDAFLVRCHPHGFPLIPKYNTPCASLAEAEAVYTYKFGVGMTGAA